MGFYGLLKNPSGTIIISEKFLMLHKITDFPGIAPGLFAMKRGVKNDRENIKFKNIRDR